MSFPSIVGSAVLSDNGASRTTSSSVTLPAGYEPGDLLIIAIESENTSTVSTPADWSSIVNTANGGGRLAIFSKVATGAEGASVSVTHQSSRTSHIAYRIIGHAGVVPEAATVNASSSSSPNPPALAPSWGSGDTLWLALIGGDTSANISAYPSGYSDGEPSPNASDDGVVASAWRQNATASENPGAYTTGGTPNWVAATVGIRGIDVTAALTLVEDDDDTFAFEAEADPVWEIINAQLDGATVRVSPLVRFDFLSGERRLWHGFGEVEIDSETWSGIGDLGQISEVTAGPGLTVEEITSQLFASAEALVNFSADAAESAGREKQVYLQFFDLRQTDDDGNWVEWQPLGDPLPMFWGTMGPLTVERPVPSDDPESARAVRIISVTASNAFVNRSKPPYGFYSERDQKARHPGDNIFVRVSDSAIAKVRWPKL